MKKSLKNIIKAYLVGLVIFFLCVITVSQMFNEPFNLLAIVATSIVSTILYCGYTIIDTIKEQYDKK